MGESIRVSTLSNDATFGAYLAKPDGNPRGAILVIQEIFGVNAGIRQKCDKWAAAGYLALAPDLFWRLEEGADYNPDIKSDFDKSLALMQKFDQAQGVRDLEAAIHAARDLSGGGKVGAVGYCLGGRMAYLLAARTDIDASVGYYGVMIDGLLGEKHAISNPLMLHIPTADGFVPPETQAAMHEGLDDHPRVTLHDYDGLDHGFATETGARRVEDAANLADQRTAEFFALHIG